MDVLKREKIKAFLLGTVTAFLLTGLALFLWGL